MQHFFCLYENRRIKYDDIFIEAEKIQKHNVSLSIVSKNILYMKHKRPSQLTLTSTLRDQLSSICSHQFVQVFLICSRS